MNHRKTRPISLKWGMLVTVLLCWVLPIVIVVAVAGYGLRWGYERNLRASVDAGVQSAMEQTLLRLDSALEASKAVSYDGDVRTAYRAFCEDGDRAAFYRRISDYLSRSYSRDYNFKAVFLTFEGRQDAVYSYVSPLQGSSYLILQKFRNEVHEIAQNEMKTVTSGIYFRVVDGELYMIRNLLDSDFQPYAMLVMLCDEDVLFQSLTALNGLDEAAISIDGQTLELFRGESGLPAYGEMADSRPIVMEYSGETGGHSLGFTAQAVGLSLWGALPALRWIILGIFLLVIPLLALVVWLFYRHIRRPIEILADASGRVREGERGFRIEAPQPNREFERLTEDFNAMSAELKSQFERLYEEQQALQQARIKALQSQIDPHFLNNTLEIINWEARIAGNEKMSGMIEALSTMLDANIGRDGRAQITLREELVYVDAYLYIIGERLGGRLTVRRALDADVMDVVIPRLCIQPLVENAVEHDLSRTAGGELLLRAYAADATMCIEVAHDGHMTALDAEKVEELLCAPFAGQPKKGRSVGIRNVAQRLRLLYGDQARLTIAEESEGRITAKIVLPVTK